MTFLDLCLEVVSRSRQSLRYIHPSRKRHMGYIKWSRDRWRHGTWRQYGRLS